MATTDPVDRPAKRQRHDGETFDLGFIAEQTQEFETKLRQCDVDIQKCNEQIDSTSIQINTTSAQIVSTSAQIDNVVMEINKLKVASEGLSALKNDLDQRFSNHDSPEARQLLTPHGCSSYDDLLRKIEKNEESEKSLGRREESLRNKEQSLRNKEQSLRNEKESLGNEKQRLGNEKQSLRKEKEIFLEMQMRLLGKDEKAYQETRLANIDYRINNNMSHTFDLNRFLERIDNLFDFFEGKNCSKFMAPYFPMIQSSGMGKTKLLSEASKVLNEKSSEYRCHMLICSSDVQSLPEDFRQSALKIIHNQGELRDKLCQQLNDLLPNDAAGSEPSKVVILIDEAQLLLTKDGFAFRCVRWWLRVRRTNYRVVAVFTGTSSALANFYREDPPSQSSREPGKNYYNDTLGLLQLYKPFYDLCTIGIIHPCKTDNTTSKPMIPTPKEKEEPTSYDLAVPCGRPLFALLHQDNLLDNKKEHTILKKMLLSPSDHARYQEDLPTCLAVLGTRVQMGQTGFLIASKLVGKGYAVLTSFSGESDLAYIVYPPDPVCSRLAMCLMDPQWSLSPPPDQTRSTHDAAQAPLQGCDPNSWIQQAIRLVSTGLCRPHKGDVGEVAVALLLLLCGDRLRRKLDGDYRHFAVPLYSWVQELLSLDQDQEMDPAGGEDLENSVEVPTISFIQVCRNHFRAPPKMLLCSEALEWMYKAGCACYSYQDCNGFDIFAAIQIPGETPLHVPLLVSVKTRCSFTETQVKGAIDVMCTILGNTIHEMALCVLVVIGLDEPGTIKSGWRPLREIRKGNKGLQIEPREPNVLTKGFWSTLVISVPTYDRFGLSNLATAPSMDGDEHSEVYVSQGFLHPYTQLPMKSKDLVRKGAGEPVKAYTEGMVVAFKGIWSSINEQQELVEYESGEE